MTVDDPISDGMTPTEPAADDSARASATAAKGYSFDEQTLGRSTSVFDDGGIDYIGAALPPTAPAAAPAAAAPATAAAGEPQRERALSARERRRRVKLEARRVRRIIRHIELWSVLKFSLLFYFCLWLIFVLAGVLLWSFAESSGTLENIEELVESLFALDPAEEFWSGGTIFRAYTVMTLVISIAGITFNVLIAALYNLISDLTGGIRITVIEEESARFTPPKRRQRR